MRYVLSLIALANAALCVKQSPGTAELWTDASYGTVQSRQGIRKIALNECEVKCLVEHGDSMCIYRLHCYACYLEKVEDICGQRSSCDAEQWTKVQKKCQASVQKNLTLSKQQVKVDVEIEASEAVMEKNKVQVSLQDSKTAALKECKLKCLEEHGDSICTFRLHRYACFIDELKDICGQGLNSCRLGQCAKVVVKCLASVLKQMTSSQQQIKSDAEIDGSERVLERNEVVVALQDILKAILAVHKTSDFACYTCYIEKVNEICGHNSSCGAKQWSKVQQKCQAWLPKKLTSSQQQVKVDVEIEVREAVLEKNKVQMSLQDIKKKSALKEGDPKYLEELGNRAYNDLLID